MNYKIREMLPCEYRGWGMGTADEEKLLCTLTILN